MDGHDLCASCTATISCTSQELAGTGGPAAPTAAGRTAAASSSQSREADGTDVLLDYHGSHEHREALGVSPATDGESRSSHLSSSN